MERSKLITLRIPTLMLRELDRIARELGCNRSELIREAISRLILEYRRYRTPPEKPQKQKEDIKRVKVG